MEKKYKMVPEEGTMLFRIVALRSFGNVEAGSKGGLIEKEGNLSQDGNAWICGDAKVCGNADYIVFKNWWSSGRYLTWTRSNNMWRVGCFFGTGEELIKKAYKDSEKSGREYERVVKYVESILADEKQIAQNSGMSDKENERI